MKVGRKIIYWDTAVWIAYLTGEKQWPDTVIAGMQDVIFALERGKVQLLTSSITRSEILEGRLTPEQRNLWASLLRRSDVSAIAADDRVNDRSSTIREYHQNRGVKILTPDAIHLATAVLYKADEFQTMDGLTKGGKSRRILKLNGDVGGYPLFITHPYPRSGPPTQSHLFLTNTLPSAQDATVTRAITFDESPSVIESEAEAKDGEANKAVQAGDNAETHNELQADTAHPAPVQGGNGGRTQGETASETKIGEESREPKPTQDHSKIAE